MVALEGHDPDPNFVATPSSNDLAQPLTQAGAAPCGCTPKLAGSFQLKGTTNPNDKGKITDAIADAFAKENQGINLTLPFILHEVTITNLLFPHCQHYLQTNSNRDFEKNELFDPYYSTMNLFSSIIPKLSFEQMLTRTI